MKTLADLRAAVRRRLDDVTEPYGWSDEELNGWIDEAIREASLRADLHPVVARVRLADGRAHYALDPSVVFIHGIHLESTGRPLTRLDGIPAIGRYFAWEGAPGYFRVEGRTLTVYPTPTVADRLHLRVDCSPESLGCEGIEIDLDPIDEVPLLEWVIYRAGQKRDVDFTLPNPEQYEANFTRYFGPRPSARTRRAWLESGSTSTARARP